MRLGSPSWPTRPYEASIFGGSCSGMSSAGHQCCRMQVYDGTVLKGIGRDHPSPCVAPMSFLLTLYLIYVCLAFIWKPQHV